MGTKTDIKNFMEKNGWIGGFFALFFVIYFFGNRLQSYNDKINSDNEQGFNTDIESTVVDINNTNENSAKWEKETNTILISCNFVFEYNMPKVQGAGRKTADPYASEEEIKEDLKDLSKAIGLDDKAHPERRETLQRIGKEVIKVLINDPCLKYIESITIVGCVDSQNGAEYNVRLAERRAYVIAEYYKWPEENGLTDDILFEEQEYENLRRLLRYEGRGSKEQQEKWLIWEEGAVNDEESRRFFIEVKLKDMEKRTIIESFEQMMGKAIKDGLILILYPPGETKFRSDGPKISSDTANQP